LLAMPAAELLPHMLGHEPLPRHDVERLGDVFADLRQLGLPQHGQEVGAGWTTRRRGRCLGKSRRVALRRMKLRSRSLWGGVPERSAYCMERRGCATVASSGHVSDKASTANDAAF